MDVTVHYLFRQAVIMEKNLSYLSTRLSLLSQSDDPGDDWKGHAEKC